MQLKIEKRPFRGHQDIWERRSNTLQSFLKNKLVIPVSGTTHILDFDQILYLKADSNYCQIILNDGRKILSSKTLKLYEMVLIKKGFLRVHAGYLVNLQYVTEISKEEGLMLKLINGEGIPISRAFNAQLFSGNMK